MWCSSFSSSHLVSFCILWQDIYIKKKVSPCSPVVIFSFNNSMCWVYHNAFSIAHSPNNLLNDSISEYWSCFLKSFSHTFASSCLTTKHYYVYCCHTHTYTHTHTHTHTHSLSLSLSLSFIAQSLNISQSDVEETIPVIEFFSFFFFLYNSFN